MARSRTSGAVGLRFNRQELLGAFRIFHRLATPRAGRQRRWTASMLAVGMVLMAWGSEPTLAQRFEATVESLDELYPGRRRSGRTYQGFVRALGRVGPRLGRRMRARLRQAVRAAAAERWRLGPWVVMGVDGWRFDAPRTLANEQGLGCGGRSGSGPQVWATTLLHLATGLPWAWRLGSADSSERAHLRQMIRLLPPRTLLVADAGYHGYALWRALIDAGHAVLIRVGANVRLLRRLGYDVKECDGIVYLWPDHRRRAAQPPLVLRLIRVHDGRKEMCLATSVLGPASLSDAAAAQCYRLRWGLELHFRAAKQTMQRRKLLGRTPAHVRQELHGALIGVTLLAALGVSSLASRGVDPLRLSFASALQVVRRLRRRPTAALPRGRTLATLLREAVKDPYIRHRPKAARYWPHPKHDQPPGIPRIMDANRTQIQAAQRLRDKQHAA